MQLLCVVPVEKMMRKNDFYIRYCEAHETQYGFDTKGSSNCSELNYLLSRGVMIRRRKDQVLKELPPKQRDRVYLTIDSKNKSVMNAGLNGMKNAYNSLKSSSKIILYWLTL
jgi:SWI/SNF-related matrix-associated actin-dependent regulator 1 of chromatin subfamily A